MDSLAGQSDAIRVIQGAGHQVFDSKRPLQPRKRKKKKRDFSDRSMRSIRLFECDGPWVQRPQV